MKHGANPVNPALLVLALTRASVALTSAQRRGDGTGTGPQATQVLGPSAQAEQVRGSPVGLKIEAAGRPHDGRLLPHAAGASAPKVHATREQQDQGGEHETWQVRGGPDISGISGVHVPGARQEQGSERKVAGTRRGLLVRAGTSSNGHWGTATRPSSEEHATAKPGGLPEARLTTVKNATSTSRLSHAPELMGWGHFRSRSFTMKSHMLLFVLLPLLAGLLVVAVQTGGVREARPKQSLAAQANQQQTVRHLCVPSGWGAPPSVPRRELAKKCPGDDDTPDTSSGRPPPVGKGSGPDRPGGEQGAGPPLAPWAGSFVPRLGSAGGDGADLAGGGAPAAVTLPGLVEKYARERPQAVALVTEDMGFISYGDLRRKVRRLAAQLHMDPGPVAICLDRGVASVVALLGVMRAGRAAVPIATDVPEMRRATILRLSGANTIVVQSEEFATELGGRAVLLDANGDVRGGTEEDELPPVGQELRALVIFTSGSTGEPKGVEYDHGFLAADCLDFTTRLRLDQSTRSVSITDYTWAAMFYDLLAPLAVGGSVALSCGIRDPGRLARFIRASEATLALGTAQVLDTLLGALVIEASSQGLSVGDASSLVDVVQVGEACPADLAGKFFDLAPKVQFYNLYGASETGEVIWMLRSFLPDYRLTEDHCPVGTPISSSVQLHILNEAMLPVSPGQAGEIWLGGRVASGYLGDKALTRQKFLPNPFGEGRLFNTGDLGLMGVDGQLRVIGRRDRQVKIHGARLALEEVETVIRAAPGVASAACVCHGEVLLGYVAACQGTTLAMDAVARHVQRHLPSYAVPRKIVPLHVWPALPNGKTDLQEIQRLAIEDLTDDTALEPDSMGILRALSRRQVLEKGVCDKLYALAMFGIVLYHILGCEMAPAPACKGFGQLEPVVQWVVLFLSSDWALYTFLFVMGFAESRAGGVSLGLRDCVLVALLFLTYWPIPQIMSVVVPWTPHPPDPEFANRWFLLVILYGRVLLALGRCVPGVVQLVALAVGIALCPEKVPVPCAIMFPDCAILCRKWLCCIFGMVLAYHTAPATIDVVQARAGARKLPAWVPLAALASFLLLGVVAVEFRFRSSLEWGGASRWLLVPDFLLVLAQATSLVVVVACVSWPRRLNDTMCYLGQNALGTYLIHPLLHLSNLPGWAHPRQLVTACSGNALCAIAEFTGAALIAILVMALVGPVCQCIILAPIRRTAKIF